MACQGRASRHWARYRGPNGRSPTVALVSSLHIPHNFFGSLGTVALVTSHPVPSASPPLLTTPLLGRSQPLRNRNNSATHLPPSPSRPFTPTARTNDLVFVPWCESKGSAEEVELGARRRNERDSCLASVTTCSIVRGRVWERVVLFERAEVDIGSARERHRSSDDLERR
jgi:hypothetical protein